MSFKIKSITISKFLFVFYVLYSNVLSYSAFVIKGLSTILLILALLFQIYNNKYRIYKERSFVTFIFFFLYIVLSGLIVSVDRNRMLQTAISFLEYLGSYYLVISYTKEDNKVDFPINVFILQGLVAAIVMILRGISGARVSISDNVNPNIIAVTLAFSIAFVLYEIIEHKKTAFIISIAIIAVLILIFAILLTVSKKAIISGIVLIVLWILCCYKTTFKKVKPVFKLILFLSIVAVCIVAVIWYSSNYAAQIEYVQYRMSQIGTSMSSVERVQLFKEGIDIFLKNPILGVGFNNVRFYTSFSTYTHCLYSEVLAATGVLGTVIFFYAIVFLWNKLIHLNKIHYKKESLYSVRHIYMIIIFFVLMLISITQIVFYMYNLMYILAIIAGFTIEVSNKSETQLITPIV